MISWVEQGTEISSSVMASGTCKFIQEVASIEEEDSDIETHTYNSFPFRPEDDSRARYLMQKRRKK